LAVVAHLVVSQVESFESWVAFELLAYIVGNVIEVPHIHDAQVFQAADLLASFDDLH